ncbi:MAG: hypothetical protein HY319_27640 [Armatimonadetes bacterium]|nr:hypothetical protein [Armatimonadota bacterium]
MDIEAIDGSGSSRSKAERLGQQQMPAQLRRNQQELSSQLGMSDMIALLRGLREGMSHLLEPQSESTGSGGPTQDPQKLSLLMQQQANTAQLRQPSSGRSSFGASDITSYLNMLDDAARMMSETGDAPPAGPGSRPGRTSAGARQDPGRDVQEEVTGQADRFLGLTGAQPPESRPQRARSDRERLAERPVPENRGGAADPNLRP